MIQKWHFLALFGIHMILNVSAQRNLTTIEFVNGTHMQSNETLLGETNGPYLHQLSTATPQPPFVATNDVTSLSDDQRLYINLAALAALIQRKQFGVYGQAAVPVAAQVTGTGTVTATGSLTATGTGTGTGGTVTATGTGTVATRVRPLRRRRRRRRGGRPIRRRNGGRGRRRRRRRFGRPNRRVFRRRGSGGGLRRRRVVRRGG